MEGPDHVLVNGQHDLLAADTIDGGSEQLLQVDVGAPYWGLDRIGLRNVLGEDLDGVSKAFG